MKLCLSKILCILCMFVIYWLQVELCPCDPESIGHMGGLDRKPAQTGPTFLEAGPPLKPAPHRPVAPLLCQKGLPGAGQLAFSATALNSKPLTGAPARGLLTHWHAPHPGPGMALMQPRRTGNHTSRLFGWRLCCRFPLKEPISYLKLCHTMEFVLSSETWQVVAVKGTALPSPGPSLLLELWS